MVIKNDVDDNVRIDEPNVFQPKETMEITSDQVQAEFAEVVEAIVEEERTFDSVHVIKKS